MESHALCSAEWRKSTRKTSLVFQRFTIKILIQRTTIRYLSAMPPAECRARLHNPQSATHRHTHQQNIQTTAILD